MCNGLQEQYRVAAYCDIRRVRLDDEHAGQADEQYQPASPDAPGSS